MEDDMKKALFPGLVLILLVSTGAAFGRQQAQPGDQGKTISWANFQTAKASADTFDKEGKYAEALPYYLEYARQAEGLGRPELVARGKNNAAFVIIKRHKQDSTVDLDPARKLIEEGMAIAAATDDCKKVLATNLDYVKRWARK
jgi:hypothetical protein